MKADGKTGLAPYAVIFVLSFAALVVLTIAMVVTGGRP